MALDSPNDPLDRHVDALTEDDEDDLPPGLDEDDIKDVTENADGSASVQIGEDEPEKKDSAFLDNLVPQLEAAEVNRIATNLLEAFDRDKEARKERDIQYAEGIKRTGLGNESPGGAEFDGASRAVHPVMIEGCIQFSARSMKELFPPSGPVKTYIIGEQSETKIQKAERKKTYMNWQLTKQIREYRSELETVLTQVPLGGSQYLKVWRDDRIERPRVEFVPVDDMLIPFAASDFECAERKTHVQKITKSVLQGRIDSKLYIDFPIGSGTEPEGTEAGAASDKVEGREETGMNEDGLRVVYESYVELEVKGDTESKGEQRGYIATIDETSGKLIALYRNWSESDKKKTPDTLDWIVEFGFIPWRGAYKIGLAHIIGGLSGALTGALRALLDSAHISNSPSGLIMSNARTNGKNLTPSPTELVSIQAPPNVDDIRKLAMPFPYPGPSDTLFKLMDWLTNQAKSVVTTASEAIKDAGNDMPVGTALALIEQGSITFSAVHARLHASQARVLNILHRINRDTLDEDVVVEELGELLVHQSDFEGPVDVIPVSDPNIFSEAQRYAQNQAAMAMAEKWPQVFKLDHLVRRALMLMNYPAYEEVLNIPEEPKELDALSENIIASDELSQLKVFPVQDDMAHLKAHIHFMVSPIFCANPMMGIPALPKLLAHAKDHLLALYKKHTRAAAQVARITTHAKEGDALVQGAAFADQELAKELAPLMPLLQQAQATMQKLTPPPASDPKAMAQIHIADGKNQVTVQEGDKNRQLTLQLAAQDDQQEDKENTQQNQLEVARQTAENERSTQEMQVAAHNAELASQDEDKKQTNEMIRARMEEYGEIIREDMRSNSDIMMAEVKAGHEADLEGVRNDFMEYQNSVSEQFDTMRQALEQQHAITEGERERTHEIELAQIQAKATKAKQQLAEGGSVLGRKLRWVVKRDQNTGDILSLDQEEYLG